MLTAVVEESDGNRDAPHGRSGPHCEQIGTFAETVEKQIRYWSDLLADYDKVVMWGGGSKAVAFLSTLEAYRAPIAKRIKCVVDINPRRQGTYLPAVVQKIVAPAELRELKPDLVLVMNPVYEQEICETVCAMGLAPGIVALKDEVALHD